MDVCKTNRKMYACLLTGLILVLSVAGGAKAYEEIALIGCQDECGGVKIPFPFGIGDRCFLINNNGRSPRDMYRINCDNNSNSKPLIPILGNKEVLKINLEDHSLRVSSGVAYDCYNTGQSVPSSTPNSSYSLGNESWVPIMMSSTRNKFVSIGCDATAQLSDNSSTSSCTNSCTDSRAAEDRTCDSSFGCCEASIINSLPYNPSIHVGSSSNHNDTGIDRTQLCSYAFVGEIGSYNFSATNLTATAKDCYNFRAPLVYDWFLDLSNYDVVCSSNSLSDHFTYDFFSCQCLEGYSGNPYLPYGCQDINECAEKGLNECQRQEYCVNKEGGYDCRCPDGYLGNATTASPCIPVPVDHRSDNLILGVSIGMGSMIISIILYGMYKLIKRRNKIKESEHNFKKNGGLLLQQEMSTSEGAIDRTKIFSRHELENATDNFNDNRVLGQGGQGTVYKGMLADGTIIAVKKSKKVDENQLTQFINEVVILSHINHRNVVKLFGCCLETEVPLLVYEFVPNGTLYQHIHHPMPDFHMTWKVRFQIAVECAGAVAYLHCSCSSPIYHRDIKSSNILLDERYKAKISDFGTSRTISMDKTHVTTCVQGTFGYLDPEFFRSSQFNEKSDVYSFGVVLLELLTSKKPIFTNTFGEPRGLATEFIQIMETSPNQLYGILDTQVLQNCSEEDIEELAKLIERCLSMNGKQRPTMREVAMTLEIIKSQQDKEGNLIAEQEIRGEERHVWIEGTNTTNEDASINSTISLPR